MSEKGMGWRRCKHAASPLLRPRRRTRPVLLEGSLVLVVTTQCKQVILRASRVQACSIFTNLGFNVTGPTTSAVYCCAHVCGRRAGWREGGQRSELKLVKHNSPGGKEAYSVAE